MADTKLVRAIKAQAIAQAIGKATGMTPDVIDNGDYSSITFTREQVKFFQNYLNNQIKRVKSIPPGSIRIDAAPVVLPVVLKQAAPYVLGSLLVAYLLGRKKAIF
jgi:hypothetical protein